MKLKQKHIWIFLTIVIVVVFFGVLYDVGDEKDEPPTTPPAGIQPSTTPPAGIHHDTTTGTIYGQIVYEGNGPSDQEFKGLLIVYLNDNGVTELHSDNITITSRNMINTNEEINFQINCTDCEIIEGYQVNLSTFEDCMLVSNSLHSNNNNIISCSVSSDSNIGGHWIEPNDISGYTILASPQNLKKDDFQVTVTPTCGVGWSNVLECRNSTDGSPIPVTVNGQSVDFLDINESIQDKGQYQRNCETLPGGRFIAAPTAISPTDCTNLIDPARLDTNAAACTAATECQYTASGPNIVESCIDMNVDARPYVLAGCSQNCTPPPTTPSGVEAPIENELSRFNFDVTYACADNYGLAAGIAATASPYGAEVCDYAGGPYTIPLDQCTHDCINPSSQSAREGYKCSSLLAGGTTATPTPIASDTTCEGELNNNNFNISVSCADGYSDSGAGATATACGTPGGSYSLDGCLQDCTHDPSQTIKTIDSNGVESQISYGDIYPTGSNTTERAQARFNWGDVCGANYGGSIGAAACAASTSNPSDNYYKIYGCYPTCTDAEECLNFRIEYGDVGPEFDDFKRNLLNFLSLNPALQENTVPLLNQSNFSFFRKHISNGMGVIEYQIKCDAATCDIINDTDFQQFNSGEGWHTDATAAVPGCMDPAATNFNPSATFADGSCVIPPPWVLQTTTGDTCDRTCAAAGGTCADGAWGADSEAALDTALTVAGASCPSGSGFTLGGWGHGGAGPMLTAAASGGPAACVYTDGEQECSATHTQYYRLCKCQYQ